MTFDDIHFRNIVLKFSVGDLLDRTDEAVAISCDRNFSLGFGIGRAFANRGGQALMNDVRQLHNANQQIIDPMAVSVPGRGLNCQHLILAPLRDFFRTKFEDVFLEILQCAIQLGVSSLALPPLGTGGFNMNRNDVGRSLQFALETQANFGALTQITIVDSLPHSVRYFRNILENMVEDDLMANPNFYVSNNTQTPQVPANQADATPVAAFSSFYNVKDLDALKELRKKRIEDKMQIDTPNRDEEEQLEACPVCLIDMLELTDDYDVNSDTAVVQLKQCPHLFHRQCLVAWFQNKSQCPICNTWYLVQNGNQPASGTMQDEIVRGRLPGFNSRSHIRITYIFPNGIQTTDHPRPGTAYKGTRRMCYLPDTNEGHEVLDLLREAFNRRLVFTVGDSVTSGQQNVVTWNGIHHKTNKSGGASNYGYPDPQYLDRVKQELASVGITEFLLQQNATNDNGDDSENSDSD